MMCLTSTVAQPEEFYIFIEQRKKKKKRGTTNNLFNLSFTWKARWDFSSTWQRPQFSPHLGKDSCHPASVPEIYTDHREPRKWSQARVSTCYCVTCGAWGGRGDPTVLQCLSTQRLEPSRAGKTGAALGLTVPHKTDSIQWPKCSSSPGADCPRPILAAPRLRFRRSLPGDL